MPALMTIHVYIINYLKCKQIIVGFSLLLVKNKTSSTNRKIISMMLNLQCANNISNEDNLRV